MTLQYFIDPITNTLYSMTDGASIEGVELKEISYEEYLSIQAEQEKADAAQQAQQAAADLAAAQELDAAINRARAELAGLGLSPTTLDLLLPTIAASNPTPKPKRRRA